MGRSEYGNAKDVAKLIAEQHFMYVINGTGNATVKGDALCFKTGASMDGKTVVQPATDNLSAFAGIAMQVVADGAAVEVQTAGYNAVAKVLGHASLSAGDVLVPANAVDYLVYSKAADGLPAFAVMGIAYTVTSADAAKSVMLFCGMMNH